jgi:hypothetical protein
LLNWRQKRPPFCFVTFQTLHQPHNGLLSLPTVCPTFIMPKKPAATPRSTRAAAAEKSELATIKDLLLAVTANNTQVNKRLDRMDADRAADKAPAPSGAATAGTSASAASAPRSTRGRKKQQPPPQAAAPEDVDISDAVREEISTLYTSSKNRQPSHFVEDSSSEEEEEQPQPRRTHKKGKTSKYTHWPSDYVFDHSGSKVPYESLTSEQFFMGYLAAIRRSPPSVKDVMLHHLELLSQDIVSFSFTAVRSFHAIWLQEVEEGAVAWGDDTERNAMRMRFVWNAPTTIAARSHSFTAARAPARSFSNFAPIVPLAPNSSPCLPFNAGTCSQPASHPGNDHICSYCASRFQRHCTHGETACIKKKKIAAAGRGKNF